MAYGHAPNREFKVSLPTTTMHKSICLLLLSWLVNGAINAQNAKGDLSPIGKHGSAVKSAEFSTPLNGIIDPSLINNPFQSRLIHVSYNEHEELKEVEKIKERVNPLKKNDVPNLRSDEEGSNKTTSFGGQLGSSYRGSIFDGSAPSDNGIAVSNGGFKIIVANSTMDIFNSANKKVAAYTLNDFANDASVTDSYDPRVIYDSGADRFILVFLSGSTSSTSKVVVCFSTTNNPTDKWNKYILKGDVTSSGYWFDYPNIGVSNNELYITGNLFTSSSNNFRETVLLQINKNDGFAASTLRYQYWNQIQDDAGNSVFTLVPCSWGTQGNYGPGCYFMASNAGSAKWVQFFDMTDDMSASNENLEGFNIPVTNYMAGGDAGQKGSNDVLLTGDSRMQSAFYLDGTVHFVFHADVSALGTGYCSIVYGRLDVQTKKVSTQTYGLSKTDYAFPSVAPLSLGNGDHSVVIAFLRSSATLYPEFRFVTVDNAMNFAASSTQIKAGSSFIDVLSGDERWGDYTGIARNHKDASVWVQGMYGDANNEIGNWVAQISSTNLSAPTLSAPSNGLIEVYPNPTADNVQIHFTTNKLCQIKVRLMDVNGGIVHELLQQNAPAGPNLFVFDAQSLSNGIYFVEVSTNNQLLKHEKVVVQH